MNELIEFFATNHMGGLKYVQDLLVKLKDYKKINTLLPRNLNTCSFHTLEFNEDIPYKEGHILKRKVFETPSPPSKSGMVKQASSHKDV